MPQIKNNTPHQLLLLLVLLVTAAFFNLIRGFLITSFWAIVLAILFHPLYRSLGVRLRGRKNLASALTLLIILFLVVVPLGLIGLAIVNESIYYYGQLQSGDWNLQAQLDSLRGQLPVITGWLERLGVDVNELRSSLGNAAARVTQLLAGKALDITQNLFSFLVSFFLMLYLLYFFLRDGRRLIRQTIRALPIGDDKERELFARFASVARATVKGSLVVAVTQGTIGGVLFAAVGIPASVLWGVLMTILSLLPVGSGLVWVPAAVILFFQGEIGRAIAIVVVGALIIGLIDNFLRPRLVGNDTKMPDYLILLSTLGGLASFGLPGFVLGPIIAALFVTCWAMMGREYGEPSAKKHPGPGGSGMP